jgi:CHAD domain-containing protein
VKLAPVKSRKKIRSKEAAWLSVTEALGRSLQSSLQLCDSLPSEDDVEAVHQARVQARRARMAVRLLDKTADSTFDRLLLTELLRWLGLMLGPVRDLDVELKLLDEQCSTLAKPAAMEGYRVHLQASRRPLFDALLQARNAPPYARLGSLTRDLVLALEAPEVSGKLAYRKRLKILARRVSRAASSLHSESTAEEWHELRIATRRLRYAGEALSAATGERYAGVTKAATKLQSVLGEMQDHASGLGLLTAYGRETSDPEQLEAVAELVCLRTQARDGLQPKAFDAIQRLGSALASARLPSPRHAPA